MEEGWLRVCDPWGKRWLLFPCSVVSVKSNPDDIYQWLDSSSRGPRVKYEKGEQNRREEESEDDDLQRSHICFSTPTASLMNCCWGVQHPRAHEGPVQTDSKVFALFLLQWDVWFLYIDLFRLYWPIFPVLALKPFLAHRLIWSGTTTGPCEATWTLCYNNIKTVILGLDFCPFNCRVSHRCHRNVKSRHTTWWRIDPIAFGEPKFIFQRLCLCTCSLQPFKAAFQKSIC